MSNRIAANNFICSTSSHMTFLFFSPKEEEKGYVHHCDNFCSFFLFPFILGLIIKKQSKTNGNINRFNASSLTFSPVRRRVVYMLFHAIVVSMCYLRLVGEEFVEIGRRLIISNDKGLPWGWVRLSHDYIYQSIREVGPCLSYVISAETTQHYQSNFYGHWPLTSMTKENMLGGPLNHRDSIHVK